MSKLWLNCVCLFILLLCGSSFEENIVKVSSNNESLNILDLLDIVKTNSTVSIDELAEIKMLEKSSPMYPEIYKYIQNTQTVEIEGTGQTYWWKYDVVDIFEVKRYEEEVSFKPFERNSNRRLLLHGSSLPNYIHILKGGLKAPSVYRESYCFGMGIYFSDSILKSGPFCGTANETGLILISEVAAGVPEVRIEIDRSPIDKNVSESVEALGKYYPHPLHVCSDGLKIPNGKLLQRTEEVVVSFNEFVVHDEARVKSRYLVEFKTTKPAFNFN